MKNPNYPGEAPRVYRLNRDLRNVPKLIDLCRFSISVVLGEVGEKQNTL